MSDRIDQDLIWKFIEIGKAENFTILRTLWPSENEIKADGCIMRLRPEPWYQTADSLSDEDVIALIKVLTVAEKTLPDWKAGSVSPVIWLYRKLVERRGDDESLVNWIVIHTENDYLPFGSLRYRKKG